MKYSHFQHSFRLSMEKNMGWGKGQGVGVGCGRKALMTGIFYFQCEKEPKMFLL